jgi:hypothetical protein
MDLEALPTIDPIGFEVVVVDTEDDAQAFTLGQSHESRIGEVHRAVAVSPHQIVKAWRIVDRYRENRDCSRSNKSPSRPSLARMVHQMKQLRQYR